MDDFDKNFRRTSTFIIVCTLGSIAVRVGLLGFGIWVVVKVLQHFGVV